MKTRSPLDERSFEQLLAAAYLAQQRRLREPLPFPVPKQSVRDEKERLAAIAEAHTIVHANQLSLQETLQLVTERALRITGGTGAAIWLLRGSSAMCQTGCGVSSTSIGQSISVVGSRLASCFRDGAIFRCDDAKADPRTRYDALPGMAQGSIVAVPIHHAGHVQGALEVTFQQTRGFEEADVRTCQILSGLVSETVAVAAGQEHKIVLESERATLLEALDRLQPHISKLLNDSGTETRSDVSASELPPMPQGPTPSVARLGKYLMAQQEQDKASRSEDSHPIAREVQTSLNLSVASNRLSAKPNSAKPDSWIDGDNAAPGLASEDLHSEHFDSQFDDGAARTSRHRDFEEQPFQTFEAHPVESESEIALRKAPWLDVQAEPPASKAAATPVSRFLQAHWGDVCVAAAVVVLASCLTWAFWPRPAQTVAAGNATAASSEPELTPFEELLVTMGLAEAPPAAPTYMGATGTKVWVDLHSALYYCPGAEPYGKTPKGKFLTQREAQTEQFQPARGQPCD